MLFLSKGAPVIYVEVINKTLNEGETTFFTCQATGSPIPKISWYFNDVPVNENNTMKHRISEMSFNPTTKNSTLEILKVDSSNIGVYTCNATSRISSDTSSGMLAVKGESVTRVLLWM